MLSAKRIASFLGARDIDYLDSSSFQKQTQHTDLTGPLFIQGSVTWDNPAGGGVEASNSATGFQLHDLDIVFPVGQLTLITGKFGSGKSLMLLALLGEARLTEGQISYAFSNTLDPNEADDDGSDWNLVADGIAYVPQVSISQCIDGTIGKRDRR